MVVSIVHVLPDITASPQALVPLAQNVLQGNIALMALSTQYVLPGHIALVALPQYVLSGHIALVALPTCVRNTFIAQKGLLFQNDVISIGYVHQVISQDLDLLNG
jgi:hypothetical protein